MAVWKLVTLAVGCCLVGACGGETEPAKSPDTPVAAATPTETAAATPAPNAGQPQVDSGAPPLQGEFVSIVRAAASSKEDKIGEKDGDFKPDGVKDLIFDVEFKGPVAAFIVASVDAEGTPTGEWDADSLAGKEIFPGEILKTRDARDVNAGIVVYQDGKMLNKPTGGIEPFADGSHKLTLRISSKKAKKGPVRAFAMLADRSIVTGPIVPAGK
jgi:hypothetical protein